MTLLLNFPRYSKYGFFRSQNLYESKKYILLGAGASTMKHYDFVTVDANFTKLGLPVELV